MYVVICQKKKERLGGGSGGRWPSAAVGSVRLDERDCSVGEHGLIVAVVQRGRAGHRRAPDVCFGAVVEVDPATLGRSEVAAWGAVVPVVRGAGSVVAEERLIATLRRQAVLLDVPYIPLTDSMCSVSCTFTSVMTMVVCNGHAGWQAGTQAGHIIGRGN